MKRLRPFFLRHFEASLIAVVILGVVLIAFLVRYKFAFLNFFFLPVILAGYYLGRKQAVLSASLCILLVVFYLLFPRLLGAEKIVSLDDAISIAAWGGFLILTGALFGSMSEQREVEIRNLRRAYIGVLDIMLKYLELVDTENPRSLRVSVLAGRIAQELKLKPRDIENIKTTALLMDAGDLTEILPLFEKVGGFIKKDVKGKQRVLKDREMVLLQTTAALLKDVGPILSGYVKHYVDEADIVDKNLNEVPLASSIVALASLYDRIVERLSAPVPGEKIETLTDIEKLSGRSFTEAAVEALKGAASSRP